MDWFGRTYINLTLVTENSYRYCPLNICWQTNFMMCTLASLLIEQMLHSNLDKCSPIKSDYLIKNTADKIIHQKEKLVLTPWLKRAILTNHCNKCFLTALYHITRQTEWEGLWYCLSYIFRSWEVKQFCLCIKVLYSFSL